METVQVNIVTPDGPVLETEAEMIIASTEAGEIGVLPGHIAMVAPLGIGALRVKLANDETKLVAVHGGFIEIRPDVVTVLATSAEKAESIDLARAQIAEKRAKAILEVEENAKEFARAELELKRAINRIRVGSGNM